MAGAALGETPQIGLGGGLQPLAPPHPSVSRPRAPREEWGYDLRAEEEDNPHRNPHGLLPPTPSEHSGTLKSGRVTQGCRACTWWTWNLNQAVGLINPGCAASGGGGVAS